MLYVLLCLIQYTSIRKIMITRPRCIPVLHKYEPKFLDPLERSTQKQKNSFFFSIPILGDTNHTDKVPTKYWLNIDIVFRAIYFRAALSGLLAYRKQAEDKV